MITQEATRELAASPRENFQEVDFSFYYPRVWYEAIIARAAGDTAKAKSSFAAARAIFEQRLTTKPNDPRTLAVLAQTEAGLARNRKRRSLTVVKALQLMSAVRDAYDLALVKQGLAQVYDLERASRRRPSSAGGIDEDAWIFDLWISARRSELGSVARQPKIRAISRLPRTKVKAQTRATASKKPKLSRVRPLDLGKAHPDSHQADALAGAAKRFVSSWLKLPNDGSNPRAFHGRAGEIAELAV